MYTRVRYKYCLPQNTVDRIKKILKSIDLDIEEEWFSNNGGSDSCRIRISNKGLRQFDIGTNGKGMNREFALASAYGEFMERLQNKTLFREGLKYSTKYCQDIMPDNFTKHLRENGLELNYLYFPDEVLHESSIYAPFVEYISNKYVLFPISRYRSQCGSTGLCAGNTKEEAICQGLNEIVERYVLRQIFDKQPNPKYFLKLENFIGHEIYSKLKLLEINYYITIHTWHVDFFGFPVIGLLIQRKSDNAYTYRLGADFNAVTALERCFTETFQGEDVLPKLLKPLDENYKSTWSDYMNCRHNGTGIFPVSLIHEDDNAKYVQFAHYDFVSYEEELNFYLSIFRNNGFEVYIKDNSFLGFPAYAIYIPGISCPQDIAQLYHKYSENQSKEYHFEYIEGRYNLLDMLSKNIPQPISSVWIDTAILRLNPWNSSKSNLFYFNFAAALRHFVLKEWDMAYGQIKKLIDFLIKHGVSFNSKIIEEYRNLLKAIEEVSNHGLNIIDPSLQSYKALINSPKDYISKLLIPKCFDCNNCNLKADCYYFAIVTLEKKLQNLQMNFYETGNMVEGHSHGGVLI